MALPKLLQDIIDKIKFSPLVSKEALEKTTGIKIPEKPEKEPVSLYKYGEFLDSSGQPFSGKVKKSFTEMTTPEKSKSIVQGAGSVAKTIAQETARSGASLVIQSTKTPIGLSLNQLLGKVPEEGFKPAEDASEAEKKAFSIIFGDRPLKGFTGMGEETLESFGADKLAKSPVAPVLGGIMAGLDITTGGGKDDLIKAIVKVNKVDDAIKIGKSLGLADNLIDDFAKNAVKAKTAEQANKLLTNFTSKSFDTTKATTKATTKIVETAETADDAISEITSALKDYKNVRKAQETGYTAERAKRFAEAQSVAGKTSGESGFYQEISKLKGALPKQQFEGIRTKLSQENIDSLFNTITQNPNITYTESLSAKKGLARLLGEFGGGVPTESELKILERVFPKELVSAIKGTDITLGEKIKEGIFQAINLPRALMSSFGDLSFGFRQGAFVAPSYRKEFFSSFKKQFGWFAKEDAYKAVMDTIKNDELFEYMRGRVAFTNLGEQMTLREERYMSNWAEKIPLLGEVVKATERAYTGFANKMRADIFKDLFKKAEVLGLNPAENKQMLDEIAKFANVATGRGDLKMLEGSAKVLNAFFFSPRLMSSRLILMNPKYYIKATPVVRRQALKSLFAFAGTQAAIITAAKLAGAEVETDMRSSDWGKIKIGNLRIDTMGGFQQYIRSAAQLITGKYISSTTGKEITLGEGYKPMTRLDILLRQVESKEAPVASFVTDLLKGQDYKGEPIKVGDELLKRITPMIVSDIIEIAKEEPDLVPLSILGIFGIGIQAYSGSQKWKVKKTNTQSTTGEWKVTK